MKTITQIPFLNEILSLKTSERMFVMNKIYESLLNDLPISKKDHLEQIPEWLKKNLDKQTKEYTEGKLKTYTWQEVMSEVNICKETINLKR